VKTLARPVCNNSVTVIICYSEAELEKVQRVLAELRLTEDLSIVLIDARDDNKPSASKA
jgi:hypothetical protein